MRRITGYLYAWGDRQVRLLHRTGHPPVNVLYRYFHEGEVSPAPFRSRPLIHDSHSSDDAWIEQALFCLPQPQRDCVVLRHCEVRIDGKAPTSRDMARILNISENSFKAHLRRGRRRLESLINNLRESNGLDRIF